jgi:hypothetical protein
MDGMQIGAALAGNGRLTTDRPWVRWGVAAAITAMVSWVAGVALIPLDAKLEKGNQHLAQVLRGHTAQLYAAALLAIVGAVLLAAFFAVLTRLVPEGHPGWGLLRVSLAACVITQTLVAVGASLGLAGLHAAAGNSDEGLVALGWRGLWARLPRFGGADHVVHGDRGAGAAAGRAFPAMGICPGLAVGSRAPAGAVHPRPARRIRARRDHRRARPAHYGHLDPRPGRDIAQVVASSRRGQLIRRPGIGTRT